ncbi:MAG: TonB-dependent receptor [Bdellovibrionales bacterium]|nr:TonB-dependent receptor [Bdellovibrionales bacterium]
MKASHHFASSSVGAARFRVICLCLAVAIFCDFASAQTSSVKLREGDSAAEAESYEMKDITVEEGSSSDTGRSYFGKFVEDEVSSSDIKAQQSDKISEVLDLVPGVDNIGGPRKESQLISIRGFQPSQVLLLLDGSRQNFQMSHNSIIPVRNHLLSRADVMKGGASSRFGSGALGGVVSFQTMNAEQFLKQTQNRTLQLRNNYSSNGESNQVSVTGGTRYGDKAKNGLLLDVTTTNTSNIDQVNGEELQFSGYQDQSFWGKNNFELGNGHRFTITAEEHSKDSRTPINPQGQVDPVNNAAAEQVETFKSVRGQYKLSRDSRFRPEVLIYNTQTEMVRDFVDRPRTDVRFVETNGVAFHSIYDLLSGENGVTWELQPGAELYRDASRGDQNGQDFGLFPDGVMNSQGYYLQSMLNYKDWFWVQSGIRYDQVDFASDVLDESRTANEASPEVQLGFQITEQVGLALSYEEGFSAPGVRQMFPDGVHFPMGRDPISGEELFNSFIPNLNLQPEDSRTYEAKLMVDWEAFQGSEGSLRTSVYRSEITNYIAQDFGFDTTQFVNRDLVDLQGLEVQLTQAVGAFNIVNGFSRVRGERTFERLPLGTAPAGQLSTRIEYRDSNFAFGLQRLEFFRQDRVSGNGTDPEETPGFELYNVYFARSFKWMDSLNQLRLRVNNVADSFYRRHGTPLVGQSRDIRLEYSVAL